MTVTGMIVVSKSICLSLRNLRPCLAGSCISCHSPETLREAGIILLGDKKIKDQRRLLNLSLIFVRHTGCGNR